MAIVEQVPPPSFLNGILPVTVTPFDESGRLDLAALRRLGRWLNDAGVDGIVCNGNAGEVSSLSMAERRSVVENLREAVPETPLVVGVSGPAQADSLELARHAAAAGAVAVMATPPYPLAGADPEVEVFYRGLAGAAGLPVVVQNTRPPFGRPMSAGLLIRLAGQPSLRHVKEEAFDSSHRVGELAAAGLDVAGGEGARHLFNQRSRGAVGMMPASSLPEAYVAAWRAWAAGAPEPARDVYVALLPLVVMSDDLGPRLHKDVLVRRGVIESDFVRQPGWPVLDATDREEIASWLRRLDGVVAAATAAAGGRPASKR